MQQSKYTMWYTINEVFTIYINCYQGRSLLYWLNTWYNNKYIQEAHQVITTQTTEKHTQLGIVSAHADTTQYH